MTRYHKKNINKILILFWFENHNKHLLNYFINSVMLQLLRDLTRDFVFLELSYLVIGNVRRKPQESRIKIILDQKLKFR